MNLPNKLTVVRMLLIPVFIVAACLEKNQAMMIWSTAIFALASITDFFDGYLARKHNMITDFGKFMDPLADKALVAAALLILVQIQRIEAWAVLIIIVREYSISIIRAIASANGKVIAASGGGKIKTVLQMLSVIMLLLSIPFANIVFYLAVAMTLYSGVEYIWKNKNLIEER